MKKLFESNDWATCSSCGAARNRGHQCNYCGTLYADTIKRKDITRRKDTKTILGSLSSKYQISRRGGELRISWRWASWGALAMIPFFIFWNSIVFSMVPAVSGHSSFFSGPFSYIPVAGIHMLVGIAGPIYVLIQLVNRTTIIANKRHLIVKKHPIPWGRNHKYRADDIRQLFVSKTQKSSDRNSWNVPELQLITKNGDRYRLLTGNKEVEFADYETFRQLLSSALEIDIVSVHGAVFN